jgi:hypothetical protein
VNLACSSTDLIVIIVPNGQTASLLHNINFAPGSGLSDDQLLFVINSTSSSALLINNTGNSTETVHGDYFVDNGGGYTIGGSNGKNNTIIDGRVFAGGATTATNLVWNHNITLSSEPLPSPEPGTWALMIGGLFAMIWFHRQRRKARA